MQSFSEAFEKINGEATAVSKRFVQGAIVQVNPTTKKIVGAINQAKKEQQEGLFDINRQQGFMSFLQKQIDLHRENFPESVWTDLFQIFEKILSTIIIVTRTQGITPMQVSIHSGIIKILFQILSADPGKVGLLNLRQEEQVEALSIARLIQSSNPENVEIGANFCMLLLHHSPELTLHSLLKFDIESKDLILKRENNKLWGAVNLLGQHLAQYEENLKESLTAELDTKIETEMELNNNKISKQIIAFVTTQNNDVTKNLTTHVTVLEKQEAANKALDSKFSSEIAKLQKQITDLGQGKITSPEELEQVGNEKALIDERQNTQIAEIKSEFLARIEILHKEIKQLKIGMSSGNLTDTFAHSISGLMRRASGPDLHQQLDQSILGVDTRQDDLKHKIEEQKAAISQLNKKIEQVIAQIGTRQDDVKTNDISNQIQKQKTSTAGLENSVAAASSNTDMTALEQKLKALEDRTKQGFLKVKDDLAKIKEEVKSTENPKAQQETPYIAVIPDQQPIVLSVIAERLTLLEEKTKNGFLKAKTDQDKLVDLVIAKNPDAYNQEVLEMLKENKTGLVSLTSKFESFSSETKTAIELVQSTSVPRAQLKQIQAEGLPAKSVPEGQDTAQTMIQALEERIKKGFLKVKDDIAKVKTEKTQSLDNQSLHSLKLQIAPQLQMEEMSNSLKALEERAKKGFLRVKDDFARMKEEIGSKLQVDLNDAQARLTLLAENQEALKSFLKEKLAQLEPSLTALKSEPLDQQEIPKAGKVFETKLEEITKSIKTLEDRAKQGFLKVKDDLAKMKEEISSKHQVDLENSQTFLALHVEKLEAFQKETKAAIEEIVKKDIEKTNTKNVKTKKLESSLGSLQITLENKLDSVVTNLSSPPPALLEAPKPSTSSDSKSDEVQKFVYQALEDRTKKGFLKVRDDLAQVQVQIEALKSAQEEYTRKFDSAQVDFSSKSAKLEALQVEMNTTQEELKRFDTKVLTKVDDERLVRIFQEIAEQRDNLQSQVLKLTEVETTLTTLKSQEKTQNQSESSLRNDTEMTIAKIFHSLKVLEDKTKAGFLKVKEDVAKVNEEIKASQSPETRYKTPLDTVKADQKPILVSEVAERLTLLEEKAKKTNQQTGVLGGTASSAGDELSDKIAQTESKVEHFKQIFTEQLQSLTARTDSFKTEITSSNLKKSQDTTQKFDELYQHLSQLGTKLTDELTALPDEHVALKIKFEKTKNAFKEKFDRYEETLQTLTERFQNFKSEAVAAQKNSEQKVMEIEQRLDTKLLDLTSPPDLNALLSPTSMLRPDSANTEEEIKVDKEDLTAFIDAFTQKLNAKIAAIQATLAQIGSEKRERVLQQLQSEVNLLREEIKSQPLYQERQKTARSNSKTVSESVQADGAIQVFEGKINKMKSKLDLYQEASKTEIAALNQKIIQINDKMDLQKAIVTSQDNPYDSENHEHSDREVVDRHLSQLQDQISQLKLEIQPASQAVQSQTVESSTVTTVLPIRAAQGDFSEAAITELNSKMDSIQKKTKQDLEKFKIQISELKTQVEARKVDGQNENSGGFNIGIINKIDEKIDAHVEETQKQSKLVTKLENQLTQLLSREGMKSRAETPNETASIDPDQHFKLQERVDSIDQELKSTKQEILQIQEQIKLNQEHQNSSIKTTEHQALREEFEHFQKELRRQIVTTDAKIESGFQETQSNLKALDKKINAELSQIKDTYVPLKAFESYKIELKTQKENFESQLEGLQYEIEQAKSSQEDSLESATADLVKKIETLDSLIQKEVANLNQRLETQRSDASEKLEEATLRQTECEEALNRQLLELEAIRNNLEQKSKTDAEISQGLDMQIRDLKKQIKNEMNEGVGKIKADVGLCMSDMKVFAEKIAKSERYLDRIRASNPYGEPITNYNEDSATKAEMQEFVKVEVAKVFQRLKELKRFTEQTEAMMTDIKEDVKLMGKIQTKLSEKMDAVSVAQDTKGARVKMEQASPRSGVMDTAQLKRILALIENNSQALSLQRETFTNIMVRVQMLEKGSGRNNGADLSFKSHQKTRSGSGILRDKKLSILNKASNESSDVSLVLPSTIDARKSSRNQQETPKQNREFDRPLNSALPASLQIKANIDSDMAIYDQHTSSPNKVSKRSNIRANLYSQTPNGSVEGPKEANLLVGPVKAKRFSIAHESGRAKNDQQPLKMPNLSGKTSRKSPSRF